MSIWETCLLSTEVSGLWTWTTSVPLMKSHILREHGNGPQSVP